MMVVARVVEASGMQLTRSESETGGHSGSLQLAGVRDSQRTMWMDGSNQHMVSSNGAQYENRCPGGSIAAALTNESVVSLRAI